jgi:hypothetical protein
MNNNKDYNPSEKFGNGTDADLLSAAAAFAKKVQTPKKEEKKNVDRNE